ncbi:MAG: Co2+/Mg2+ efflux protein ApaG [Flavobacteriales bacterium]|nr:Co2+/Mg2+ efflux protein ApaG [Flavobacteriales bacterium]|tara:strand:- start:5378 stop:5764 length:387 start_codon:yes stop_codon:yes gene_type:complete
MESLTTEGVEVTVRSNYEEEFSKPSEASFIFSYSISIKNDNDFSVKLLSRKWFVFDSKGEHYEVEGNGVIGQQPSLSQNESYNYDSGASLTSPIGRMRGYYIMENLLTREKFKVYIPEFDLIAPFVLN